MNRTSRQTIAGCIVGLALGASAAFVLPHSFTGSAPQATAPAVATSAPRPQIEVKGPLGDAYRSATGAKRWLLLVSASEHASAAEMSTLIRIARNDPAAVRMLAEYWAELDPSAMFSSLYADYLLPKNTPGALPNLPILTDVLFEHWSKSDLPGAIRALTDVPGFTARDSLRSNLAREALKLDVDTGLRLMFEWGIRSYEHDAKIISAWAARDPQHAAETVLKLTSGHAAQSALKEIGKAWGASDPAGGLRFSSTLGPRQRSALGTDIMRTWAGTDLKSATAFAAAQPDAFRNEIAPGLVETWGKSDPAAALAWSQENLKGSARTEAIAATIKSAAEKSLTAASQLVSDMEPGAVQNRACASIFETWFAKGAGERDTAIEWLARLPDPAARTAALERVQWEWIVKEPEAVRKFISGPHGDLASQELISYFARVHASKDPEAEMKWAGTLGANRATEARSAVLASWLQIRPDSAADYARALPGGPERESALLTVTQNLMWQSPEKAGAWIASLSAAEQKTARETLDRAKLSADQRQKIEAAAKKP